MRFRRSLTLLSCGAALALGPRASAQVTTANLQGIVRDASGAGVLGATVKAVNVETAVSRETTSDERGLYRFNLLPRGRYEVQASKSGYAGGAATKVDLSVGETATVDLPLALSGRAE